MLSKVHSLGLAGIAGYGVETECYIGTGLPAFELVGLPDASVKEARERVRAAVIKTAASASRSAASS